MAITGDKLKNDYSNKSVLVIDNNSFYGDALSTVEYAQTIAISDTDTGNNWSMPSKVDPFRQAIGKLYSFDSSGGTEFLDKIRFFDVNANKSNSSGNNLYKKIFIPKNYGEKSTLMFDYVEGYRYNQKNVNEPISDIWEDLFVAGSYGDTFNFKRKATRMVVEFDSPGANLEQNNLIQNRLNVFSMFADIQKKNRPKSVQINLDKESSGDYQYLLTLLEDKTEELEAKKKEKSTAEENLPPVPGPGEPSLAYDNALIYINELSLEIAELETDQAQIQQLIDNYEVFDSPVLTFLNQQGGSGFQKFNYDSVILKGDIDITQGSNLANDYGWSTFQALENAESTPFNDLAKLAVQNTWEYVCLEAMNTLVESSRLDSFYDFYTGKNKYKDSGVTRYYRDAAFSMPLPMSTKSLVNSQDKSNSYIEIKPTYNYYSRYYETATVQYNIPIQEGYSPDGTGIFKLKETFLPLIYEVPLEQLADFNEVANAAPQTQEQQWVSKFEFENFGYNLLSCTDSYPGIASKYGMNPQNQSKNFNIIINQTDKQFLDKYDSLKNQFPFYVDVKFKTEQNKKFATLFNDSGVTKTLINIWISNFFYPRKEGSQQIEPNKDEPIADQNSLTATVIQEGLYGKYHNPSDFDPKYNNQDDTTADICKWGDSDNPNISVGYDAPIYTIEQKKEFYKVANPSGESSLQALIEGGIFETKPTRNYRQFDLNTLLDKYLKIVSGYNSGVWQQPHHLEWLKGIHNDDIINVVSKTIKSPSTSDSEATLSLLLDPINFVSKYKQMVEKEFKDYIEILNTNGEEETYNETLFYRIEKVAIDSSGNIDEGGLVQNIWMVKANDDSNKDIMKYIDTQVRYGQKYRYTVYAYQLVVGSKYGFQFINDSITTETRLIYDDNAGNLDHTNPDGHTNQSEQGGVILEDTYADLKSKNNQITRYFNSIKDMANYLGYPVASEEYVYQADDGGVNRFHKLEIIEGKDVTDQIDKYMMMFDVICEPDVQLIEMPVYETVTSITDAPPMFPEVDIVPLNGKQNDIKINFYPGSVSREMEPIALSLEDYGKFDKVRKAQDRDLFKQKYAQIQYLELLGVQFQESLPPGYPPSYYVEPRLKFKSDDFVTHYEIYRLDSAPKNYEAFVDNLHEVIDSKSQSSYTDTIDQNKKYYYIFRSLDVHGNISNPSPVYQVEMVENSGVVYPIISVYDFEQEQKNIKSKPFKRYLKIDASPLQGMLDLEASGIESALDAESKPIYFGTESEKLFGVLTASDFGATPVIDGAKKFKFRLKSKHTGKIVDLNVKFKVRKNQTNETIPTCGDDGGAFIEQNYPEAGSDTMHEGAGSDNGGNNEGHSW